MQLDYVPYVQILAAFAAGATLGLEREYHNKPAGFRTMVKMNNCQLNNVAFTGCKLTGTSFIDCNDTLLNVRFENCPMDYSLFSGKKLTKTPFVNCSLRNADFTECDLGKTRFTECNLENAVFHYTNLKETDFSSAYNYTIDPEANTLRKAKFSLQGVPGLLAKYGIEID